MDYTRIYTIYKRWIEKQMVVAFVLSAAIHGAVYLSYGELKKLNWRGQEKILQLFFPASKHQFNFNPAKYLNDKLAFLQKLQNKVTPPPQNKQTLTEPPLLFVSVPPSQAATEPPKNAKFYSDKDSVAANPKTDKDTDKPKIDGKQDKVMQTADIPKPVKPEFKPEPKPQPVPEPKPEITKPAEKKQPQPLQPLPQTKPQNQEKQIASKKPTAENFVKQEPGDTNQRKPEPLQPGLPSDESEPQTGPTQKPQNRPLTLAEARSRQQGGTIAGEKMKQEGGVKRYALEASIDAKATPFGAYDSSVFYAIQQRWYDLLENSRFTGDRRGKVVVDFRLHYDGRVTDLKIAESNVGELLTVLCRKAIEDPAPFEKWPADMRRMIGEDYREVRITFYYL